MGNRSTDVLALQHPTDRIRLDCSHGSVVKQSYAHFYKDRLVRSFLYLASFRPLYLTLETR
ncbi:hypothetical protein VCRLGP7_630080 [Vibrio crassostreae]|nr:hypothetical protein VCRLGP107_230079 [Vibrio crassostreae]CDT37195.1 hypothetical protein VCRLGP7_630080 [Vibrio crassostreae]